MLQVTVSDGFYDYDSKHSAGKAIYEIPAQVSKEIRRQAISIAERVYCVMGCHGPLRVDMMLGRSDGLQVLEVNTVPGLSHQGIWLVLPGA